LEITPCECQRMAAFGSKICVKYLF
jgi:hypothetical protein